MLQGKEFRIQKSKAEGRKLKATLVLLGRSASLRA